MLELVMVDRVTGLRHYTFREQGTDQDCVWMDTTQLPAVGSELLLQRIKMGCQLERERLTGSSKEKYK